MFDFVKRVLLQRPSTANVREVYNHINATLGNVTTRVNLTTDRNAFRAATHEVNNLNRGLKQSKSLADDFAAIVANATRRFAGISIATGTMLALVRGVKNAYKESLEFERQMKRVEIATGATESEVRKLSDSVLALGSAYGVSSLELAGNARIFAQAGLSARTTAKALEILAKTSVAGTFGDIADTAEGVVASLQQFREEVIKTGGEVQFLERTFDSIQNVSKKYAVEAEDIVIGIRKAGAAFESAGGTIDELIGTMTTLRSTTRESASTLANAMKTIFTRIQRPETIDFLRNMGIELVDMEGKFVGPIEAINKLGAALAVLDKGDVRYAQIADKIGGIYQINRLLTLLKNTSMTSQAIDTSRDSSGVLSEDAQKGLETTISKIERLNQKFFDLIKTLGDTSAFKWLVDQLIKIADSAISVTKSLEPLMPMIGAMAAITGGRFAFGVGRRLMGIAKNPAGMAQTQVGGVASGGYIGGFGGRIKGGAPGIDTVPAMLDNGEFVVNRKDAAKHLGLLTAINNGRDIPGFAKGGLIRKFASGGSVGDPAINTIDPARVKTSSVDSSTVLQDLNKTITELSKTSVDAAKKLLNVIKVLENTEDPKKLGEYAPDQKKLTVNKGKYSDVVMQHEIGHAADVSGGSGKNFPSATKGTINNILSQSAMGLATRNIQASGASQGNIDYRTQPHEVYAELFANVDAPTKALMVEISSASTEASHVKAALTKLYTKINEGSVTFGSEINNNIRAAAKQMGVFDNSQSAVDNNLNIKNQPSTQKSQQIVSSDDTLKINSKNYSAEVARLTQERIKKTGEDFSTAFKITMERLSNSLKNELAIENMSPDFVGPATKEQAKAGKRVDKLLPFMRVTEDKALKSITGDMSPDYSGREKNAESKVSNKRQRKAERKIIFAEEYNSLREQNLSSSSASISQATMKKFGLGGPGGPKNPNTPNSPGGPGGGGPGGPGGPNDPSSQFQQLGKSSSDFTQKLLLAGGVLAILADVGGLTSDSFNNASAAAAATYATFSVMGSAIKDTIDSFSNVKIPTDIGGGGIDIGGGDGGSSKKGGRLGRLKGMGGKIGGRIASVGRFAGGSALTGVGVGLAAAQFGSSYYSSEAQKKEQQNNETLKTISEKGGGREKLAELQAKSKAAAMDRGRSENAMTGGIGGTASGALAGAAIGSIVPGIGTALGAGVGAAVGGIGGTLAGIGATTEKSMSGLITTTERLTLAQLTAAQGMYDFETSVANAKKSGLEGEDLINALKSAREQAQSSLKSTKEQKALATGEMMDEKTWSNWIGSFGSAEFFGGDSSPNAWSVADIGIGSKRGEISASGQESLKKFSEAEEQQQQTASKAAQEEMSARKDLIIKTLNSSKSLEDLDKVSNSLGPELSAIGQLAYDATVGTEEEKRKAQQAELDGVKAMQKKIVEAKGAEIVKTQASIIARQLEIDSIQRTAAALTSFNKQSLDISKSSQALQQFQTGSSDILSGQILSDMTNVSNRSEFNNTARAVGNTFTGGQEAARNVVIGSDFINKFQSGITGAMGKNFETISGGSLDASKTQQSIQNELYNNIDSFRNMDTTQQKAIVSAIQTEMGDGFSAGSLKAALDKITGIFQEDASKLAKQSDLINQNVAAIKAWNDALVESQMKTTELRAGQVDILSTGNNRMSQVMSRYGNVGTEMRALDSQEGFRTARANTLLEGSGVAPIAGNTQALSTTLQDLQNRKSNVDAQLKNTVDPVQRNNLVAENQKLATATAAVTNELGRLASQSDRAADIMSKIEKQRQIRDYQSNRAKDFITGGRDTRMKMFEETAAMQNVMQTGSFQNIPDELKGAVRQMMEERAKLDPTGGMQKALDRALTNDARALGIDPRLVMNQPDNAEKQLINELQALQVKEFQAQQALISAQDRNTQAMLQLINQMAAQMGQQINPAFMQQPQQQMQPNMGQRLNAINNDFNQMQMNHQLNINGQINLPGLNMDGIAKQMTEHIGNYVAQEVARQINQRNRGFNAGG